MKGGNHSDIKAKMDALNNVWNEASTKMYESARAQQPGNASGGKPPEGAEQQQQQQQTSGDKGKKVEDADFEVVDDK